MDSADSTVETVPGARKAPWRVLAFLFAVVVPYEVATVLLERRGTNLSFTAGTTIAKPGNNAIVASRLSSLKNVSSSGSLSLSSAANSATGTLFRGEKIRSIAQDYERLVQIRQQQVDTSARHNSGWSVPNKSLNCDKASVVTTIFPPSEAIRRAAMLPDWCLVIVADTKTPKDYMEQLLVLHEQEKPQRQSQTQRPLQVENIHYLSIEDQQAWAEEVGGAVGKFIQAIPYRHFARKNIGYLYAIQLKAKFVFDFDDDNLLALKRTRSVGGGASAQTTVRSPLPNQTHLEGARVAMTGRTAFNHHTLMQASVNNSWPRGFPLQYIQDTTTKGRIAYTNVAQPMDRIAVMQFCADGNPDIDAIHRLVHPLPMNFAKSKELRVTEEEPLTATTGSLIIPHHTFVPYNAQATVHTAESLWALFLPFTVPGRVSDIWRGYFAQALFRDVGLSIAMLPPMIVQDRNAHDYLGDFAAESDLYLKAGKLIDFLSLWKNSANNIPDRMEQLWIDLYERSYIEMVDVEAIQLWLAALEEIQYSFPRIKRRRIDNIALMGQFNYNDDLNSVMFWNQRWREVFHRVIIRGPFPDSKVAEMRSHGLDAHQGRDDRGHISPMENLMRTLQETRDEVDGVIYAHEDMYLNITRLVEKYDLLQADSVIANTYNRGGTRLMGDPSLDPREVMKDPKGLAYEHVNKTTYSIGPDGTFSKIDGFRTNDTDDLVRHLLRPGWQWWKRGCIDNLQKVAMDPRSRKYAEMDGTFLVPTPGAAEFDFLFVPTFLTDEFSEATQLMVDHEVFLECGFPKIVDILRRHSNATIKAPILCTYPSAGKARGSEKVLQQCISHRNDEIVTIHPYKIYKHGMRNWSMYFDQIAG